MKVSFLGPSDRIVLFDCDFPHSVARIAAQAKSWGGYPPDFLEGDFLKNKVTMFPKGTELVVSQVYIRDRGYYDSNINFRLPKNYAFGRRTASFQIDLEDIEGRWDVDIVH